MRLSPIECQIISQIIHQEDAEAEVYLYGSRVDDNARGGDIDLLVLSQKIDLMRKLDILAQLHQRMGERKIDIAIYPDSTRPFARIAIQSGVRI
jgi:predicted nucleotidyltransferase